MNYIIRQATPNDANQVAPLIYDAIGDIAFRITGQDNEELMLQKLAALVKDTNNRHSYLNTFVAAQKDGAEIYGIIVLYDGVRGNNLDRALEKALLEEYQKVITIDVEAHPDEFYIDTICVSPNARGLGLGTSLLQFAEKEARLNGYKKLSLNVEVQKDKARALYTKVGFEDAGPWTIIDEPFIHMVKLV